MSLCTICKKAPRAAWRASSPFAGLCKGCIEKFRRRRGPRAEKKEATRVISFRCGMELAEIATAKAKSEGEEIKGILLAALTRYVRTP